MKTILSITSAILLLSSGAAGATGKISFTTESYPPFNFRDGEEYKGSSVEQVKDIMQDIGLDYSMQMMPWARALSLATTQKDTCVFTTVHNKERDPKFKWVEPLSTSKTVLMRKAGTGVNPKTLEEAKLYVVGTQRNDYTQTILEDNGFPKIDIAADFDLTLKKLLGGRIDLVPLSYQYFSKLKRDGVKVEVALTLAEDIYSIACNPSVDDETIAQMQASLDRLIRSGEQKKIFEKYDLQQEDE